MAETGMIMNFKSDKELNIRYDVTITPTADSNPEFAGEIAKGMKKIPRAKKVLLIVVPDDDDPVDSAVTMLGFSVADLAKVLQKNKDEEGYVDVLAAASIAEGQIQAAERLRAARDKSRKGNMTDFLAAMLEAKKRREQEGGE